MVLNILHTLTFFIILILNQQKFVTSEILQSQSYHNQQLSLQQTNWHVDFPVNVSSILMNTIETFSFTIYTTNIDTTEKNYKFHIRTDNPNVAAITTNVTINANEIDLSTKTWSGKFNVTGNFLGSTYVYVELEKSNNQIEKSEEKMKILVIRKKRTIDKVFTGSVALFVSLLYINFGAALDLEKMKGIFLRPIGPIIGLCGQFILMPLISYALGYVLFSDVVELYLGLFFTGVSPGGGASNIWTVILQGNINLSIAMTTISNLAAFGMMPFWIFTLGRTIFERGNLGVPYQQIASFAVALIVPLLIGIGIQKYFPRVAKILVRLLKPISLLLIAFIVIFAIVTNLYLFQLFSWKIVLAGLGLPWLGYSFSWLIAKLLRQSAPDAIAIAVETGVQNTGIAIFLLRFTLQEPAADLTTVIPVSVAIMTPIPLAVLYVLQKVFHKHREYETSIDDKSDVS